MLQAVIEDCSMPSQPDVRLRLLAAPDRALYRALYTSSDVMRAIGPTLSIEAADMQFQRVLSHNHARSPGHRAWAIESARCAAPAGLIALLRSGHGAEFGLMLYPRAQGRRIGSNAIELLLAYAFQTAGLSWLEARSRQNLDRLLVPFGFCRLPDTEGEGRWRLLAGRPAQQSSGSV